MPKCKEPECTTIMCGPKPHPSGYCRACRGEQQKVFGQPSRCPESGTDTGRIKRGVADFNTTEEIDKEVKRLTDLRATTLGRIAQLEERKTQLPVPVDPATLRALTSTWNQFQLLADVLRSTHGPAFQPRILYGATSTLNAEELVRRLTNLLATNPNLLTGRRL